MHTQTTIIVPALQLETRMSHALSSEWITIDERSVVLELNKHKLLSLLVISEDVLFLHTHCISTLQE